MENIIRKFIKSGKYLGEYYDVYSFEDVDNAILPYEAYYEAYSGAGADTLTTGKCKSEEEAIEKIEDLIKDKILESPKKWYIEASKKRGW